MIIQVTYVKCKHNNILITDVLWDWCFCSYINSSRLVLTVVLYQQLVVDYITLSYGSMNILDNLCRYLK